MIQPSTGQPFGTDADISPSTGELRDRLVVQGMRWDMRLKAAFAAVALVMLLGGFVVTIIDRTWPMAVPTSVVGLVVLQCARHYFPVGKA